MSDTAVDEFLAHYGVKGMKWGKRKAGQSDSSSKPKRLSRKEFRSKVKADKKAFYEKKANDIISKTAKGSKVLISVSDGFSAPTVVTGKEFKDFLEKGGAFNVQYTDVFAERGNSGPYVRSTPQRYQKPKR